MFLTCMHDQVSIVFEVWILRMLVRSFQLVKVRLYYEKMRLCRHYTVVSVPDKFFKY